ncbi:hypothetical protein GDO81_029335 [Engystomops pustulosus]|uniref:Uncharacterized protein n=1 Tax=Engystomops pustulosus TaxID=76066 RepID=A0AAV6ZFK4_ENGPU|nr:hypothetical protein GDO81_029335 [Engystomops pustulosus]
MSVDTALYVLKESDGRGEPQLISFTEVRYKEVWAFTSVLGVSDRWAVGSSNPTGSQRWKAPLAPHAWKPLPIIWDLQYITGI